MLYIRTNHPLSTASKVVSSGLYYKHITIVNDDTTVTPQFGALLTDDARVIIYNCNMFIIQATGPYNVFNNTRTSKGLYENISSI